MEIAFDDAGGGQYVTKFPFRKTHQAVIIIQVYLTLHS
jgi:hypothetical protein